MFKEVDFRPDCRCPMGGGCQCEPLTNEDCADKANEMFDSWYRENIENAPTVHGTYFKKGGEVWDPIRQKTDTHTAKLVDVKER